MTWLLIAFIVKHFLCDFPLQVPYHYKNKGTYGHQGGIAHAAIHGMGTLLICLLFDLPVWFAAADMVIHYHIDWAKIRIGKHYGWGPTDSEQFWWLLGLDQMLHYLTYAMFIGLGSSL